MVNHDEPVTLDGQLVPLGRQLAGGLVERIGRGELPLDADRQADAADGLASGRYAAVVTIPADFSARATSFAENDADQAERATIEVQTSEVSGIADPVVGRAITAAATRALNTELTEQYLDGIYLGFNRLASSSAPWPTARTGWPTAPSDLSGGLRRTATGRAGTGRRAGPARPGADQLADGAGELSTRRRPVGTGLGQLAGGATRSAERGGRPGRRGRDLAAGARRLARGGADESGRRHRRPAERNRAAARAAPRRTRPGCGRVRRRPAPVTPSSWPATPGRPMPSWPARALPGRAATPSCPVFYAGLRAGTAVGRSGARRPRRPARPAQRRRRTSPTGRRGIDAGVGRLQSGATTYAAGVSRFAAGTGELATGADQLAGGLDQLATGTRKSADRGSRPGLRDQPAQHRRG